MVLQQSVKSCGITINEWVRDDSSGTTDFTYDLTDSPVTAPWPAVDKYGQWSFREGPR